MRRIKALLALGLIAALLTACSASNDEAASSATVREARQDYDGIPVRRTGNYRPGDREFQNRAIYNALSYLESHGIQSARVMAINVATLAPDRSAFGSLKIGGSSGLAVPPRPRYDLWFSIEGCDGSVHFISNFAGGLSSPNDKSGCLAATSDDSDDSDD